MKRIWKSILVFLAVCLLAASLASLAAAEAAQDAPVAPNAHVDPRTPAPTAKPTPRPTKKPSPKPTKKPAPKSVKLNKKGTVEVNLLTESLHLQPLKLKATVSPSGAKAVLTWSSSNNNIATVDKNGTVIGKGFGVATITVTTQNGKKASVEVVTYAGRNDEYQRFKLDHKGVLTLYRNAGYVAPDWSLRNAVKEVVMKKDAVKNGCVLRTEFCNLSKLQKLTVGSGITELGEYAFPNCEKLKQIKLPGSLKTIGTCAFNGCISLRSVTVPRGVQKLDFGAFAKCTRLREIKLPQGLKTIGQFAFYGCNALKTLTIPRSVTSIGTSSDNAGYNIFRDMQGGSNTLIRGYRGSAAEKYAEQCGIKFVAIG